MPIILNNPTYTISRNIYIVQSAGLDPIKQFTRRPYMNTVEVHSEAAQLCTIKADKGAMPPISLQLIASSLRSSHERARAEQPPLGYNNTG